jgi:uncharacterized protein (TIGR00730 family)
VTVPDRRPRRGTGDPELDRRIDELVEATGLDGRPEAGDRRRLVRDLLVTSVRLASDDVDLLDLKIASAALQEMRRAFLVFAPYEDVPKVSIFGSARTKPDDPLYLQAREVAAIMAARGWMVVTGAGPGIMAAGMEGAGQRMSLGVSIRLPFEQGANSVIASDDKLVSMRYFFTRKLMLVKESAGFVCLPGGFGTLDETFELLTLTQTGKGVPVPIVFLDVPGGTYWSGARRFIADELASRGLVEASDLDLFTVTDSPDEAAARLTGFYANYRSLRYVGDTLVIRLRQGPTPEQLRALDERFRFLCASGGIEVVAPLPEEVADGDDLDAARIGFHFAKRRYAQLIRLIDDVNTWVA